MNRRKLFFAIMVMAIATIVAAVVVSCKKEKTNVTYENSDKEVAALINRINEFQELRDAIHFGNRNGGTMTVEEMRQILDLTSNYEYSQHMSYCVGTILDTLRIPMPTVDSEGNVSENDVVATYEAFETELQKCMDAANDGRDVPSYFSILMPKDGERDINEIEIVFIRGMLGDNAKGNNNRDNDGPFLEDIDNWFWGDSLGLCKSYPYDCTSDAAQQLSEEFVFVIPAEHQGESYTISDVFHVNYKPCSHPIPNITSHYYIDPYMEDCADTWLFLYYSPYEDESPCIPWDEMNCYWRSINRNIVDPSAPLHFYQNYASPYHCCIIEPQKFYFDGDYFKVHVAHVIYCDIQWSGNVTPPID